MPASHADHHGGTCPVTVARSPNQAFADTYLGLEATAEHVRGLAAHTVPGAPADIDSPPRLIEVKAFGKSNRGYDLWLEPRQHEEARRNPDYHIYVVENVRQGEPAQFTLKVLNGERLDRLVERAREQHYFTVPWPVAEYDSCPDTLGGSPSS